MEIHTEANLKILISKKHLFEFNFNFRAKSYINFCGQKVVFLTFFKKAKVNYRGLISGAKIQSWDIFLKNVRNSFWFSALKFKNDVFSQSEDRPRNLENRVMRKVLLAPKKLVLSTRKLRERASETREEMRLSWKCVMVASRLVSLISSLSRNWEGKSEAKALHH